MGVSSASRGAPSFRLKHPTMLVESLELVHSDICRPIKSATSGGKTLFLLLVGDKSCFMWLILLQVKSEEAEAIKCIQALAEVKWGKKMRVLRMDLMVLI